MTTHDAAADRTPHLHWQTDTPRPGWSTVTALTEDARTFLHWMAVDGEAPRICGTWDGTSLVVKDATDADYLWQVSGYNYGEGLRLNDE